MPTVSPSSTITPGGTVNLAPPVGGAYGVAGVAIANISTYLLQVNVGAQSYYLPPFMEDFFPLEGNGQGPVCTAVQLPGDTQTSGTISPTWYGRGEIRPSTRWPTAITSPASIAAETAAAIFNIGVPNVGIFKKLFQGFLGTAGTTINGTAGIALYSSVNVLLGNVNGTSPLVATYQFIDSVSGFIVDSGLLSCDNTASNPNWPSWELPVVADTLIIFGGDSAVIGVVVGSNTATVKRMNSDLYPYRNLQVTVPANTANGTLFQIPSLGETIVHSDIPQANLTNYNGAVSLIVNASGAISGQLQFGILDGAEVRQRQGVFSNPGTTPTQLQIGHPYGFTSWWFITTAISPSSAVAVHLLVIPDNPSP